MRSQPRVSTPWSTGFLSASDPHVPRETAPNSRHAERGAIANTRRRSGWRPPSEQFRPSCSVLAQPCLRCKAAPARAPQGDLGSSRRAVLMSPRAPTAQVSAGRPQRYAERRSRHPSPEFWRFPSRNDAADVRRIPARPGTAQPAILMTSCNPLHGAWPVKAWPWRQPSHCGGYRATKPSPALGTTTRRDRPPVGHGASRAVGR